MMGTIASEWNAMSEDAKVAFTTSAVEAGRVAPSPHGAHAPTTPGAAGGESAAAGGESAAEKKKRKEAKKAAKKAAEAAKKAVGA